MRSYAETFTMAHYYAFGQEDGTKTPTATQPGKLNGSFRFAQAYGRGWNEYQEGRRMSIVGVRDAYHRWQETDGKTIFPEGEETVKSTHKDASELCHS